MNNPNKHPCDFSESITLLWKKIGGHGIMVLSSCCENHVTSRPVSVTAVKGKFYFQTDENFLKYKQIQKNENVALSFKNFSIEGKCRDIGKPLDGENSKYISAIKKYYPMAYINYSDKKEERLLEIAPLLIYSWSYEFTKPYMEYWDLVNRTYRKEYKYTDSFK